MSIQKMTVGQRFKKYRTEKGMSQMEVAEGICSFSTVSHLETDRKIPSPKIMGQLAERIGVPLREIMGDDESTHEVDFQLQMLRVYAEMGDHEHALELSQKLASHGDLLQHQVIELLICKAHSLLKSSQYAEVAELIVPFVEQQEIQQTVSDEILCDTFNKLGYAYFRLNDFEKAFSAFEQGYRISLKLSEFGITAARVTKNLGLTCHQLGFKEEAKRYLEKAYAFFERASDMNELANSLFYLALASGNSDYMVKALAMYEGMNMVREANMAKQHYAFYVEAKKDYIRALEKLESITDEFAKLKEIGRCVYTLSRAAMVAIDHDDLQRAEIYIQKAEKYKDCLPDENDVLCADFFKARSMFFLERKMYDQCISDSQRASDICSKMGLGVESANNLQLSAEAFHQQGMHETAYLVSKRIIELLNQSRTGGMDR